MGWLEERRERQERERREIERKRERERAEARQSISDAVSAFKDLWNTEIPEDAPDKHPLRVLAHNGVVVTYRLAPRTAGESITTMARLISAGGFSPIENQLKNILDQDRNIDLRDYEDVYGIEIIKVHRGPSKDNPYSGIVLGSE